MQHDMKLLRDLIYTMDPENPIGAPAPDTEKIMLLRKLRETKKLALATRKAHEQREYHLSRGMDIPKKLAHFLKEDVKGNKLRQSYN